MKEQGVKMTDQEAAKKYASYMLGLSLEKCTLDSMYARGFLAGCAHVRQERVGKSVCKEDRARLLMQQEASSINRWQSRPGGSVSNYYQNSKGENMKFAPRVKVQVFVNQEGKFEAIGVKAIGEQGYDSLFNSDEYLSVSEHTHLTAALERKVEELENRAAADDEAIGGLEYSLSVASEAVTKAESQLAAAQEKITQMTSRIRELEAK